SSGLAQVPAAHFRGACLHPPAHHFIESREPGDEAVDRWVIPGVLASDVCERGRQLSFFVETAVFGGPHDFASELAELLSRRGDIRRVTKEFGTPPGLGHVFGQGNEACRTEQLVHEYLHRPRLFGLDHRDLPLRPSPFRGNTCAPLSHSLPAW